MVVRNIHKRLITRLFLGWIALSVVLGIAAFFIKLEQIDDLVQDLAIAESKQILKDKRYFSPNLSEQEHRILTERLNNHIENGNFTVLELYDAEVKKLFEVDSKNADAMDAHDNYIEPKEKLGKANDSMFTDNITYERFFVHGRVFLQYVVPLFDGSHKKYGYLEGVYRADDHIMEDIWNIVIESLLLVVASVFATAILFYPIVMAMNKDLIKLTGDLSDANIGMLESLGSAIAKRDSDTSSHNYRVTIYAVTLAEELGLEVEEMRRLIKGSFLHDIGKIGISDNILLKPGKLTDEEFEQMKSHVTHGSDIVGKYAWLKDAVDVVANHHEKYDGSGYLESLRGEDIPYNARIFAIADVFDALTSKRPYKEPFSYEKTIEILTESSGKHFDPKILEVFIDLSEQLYDKVRKSEDEVLEKIMHDLVRKFFYTMNHS
ncbi:MAG: HD-GYP domain-containing protein [Nitrospirae bacterium]|nr:HD-GYP domain-containing protein [Nitrospirota bacterium]